MGMTVRCLPDGRWFDAARRTWRNGRGRPARWPDLVETAQIRHTRVVLAAAHLDHDPRNNRLRNILRRRLALGCKRSLILDVTGFGRRDHTFGRPVSASAEHGWPARIRRG